MSVPAHEALWVIQAGKLEFSRVIILDLPDEILTRLPPKDSYYEVVVKRPLFQAPLDGAISKNDLMGGMLRPKGHGGKPQKTTSRADGVETVVQGESFEPLNPLMEAPPEKSPSQPNEAAAEASAKRQVKAKDQSAAKAVEASGAVAGKSSEKNTSSASSKPATNTSSRSKGSAKRPGEKKLLDPADLFP